VGNDLENNSNPSEGVVQDGFLTERQRHMGLLPYSLRSWLQRNSMAYVFLWRAWGQVRPWFGEQRDDPLKPDKDLFARQQGSDQEAAYRITLPILSQFKAETENLGISSILVLIPTEYQVYPQRFVELVRRQGLDPSRFDLELPQRRWTEMARSVGIPVVDLLPVLRHRTSGPYLYMSLDGHLSVEGNRIAGEAIAEAVRPSIPDRREGVAP
jgi:hypothetical protein